MDESTPESESINSECSSDNIVKREINKYGCIKPVKVPLGIPIL